MKAKTKLGDRNADIIAELLKLEKYDSVNKKALCPWHLEDSPSFIYNPKKFNFKCFGCSKNTDIIDAYMHTGKTYLEALQSLFAEAKMSLPLGELGVKTKHQYRYPKEIPINEKKNVYEYLKKRGISEKVIDYTDIREDEHGNIAFNYYDSNDVLTMIKFRPSHKIDKSAGENKMWCQKDTDTTPLLFNMNRVNTSQPLLITEGEIDTLAAIESGYYNTVSIPFGCNNSGWIEENYEWLEQFDSIIIAFDNDEPGVKARKEILPRLGSWRCKYIEIPNTYYSEELSKNVNLKDINEVLYYLGKDAVLNLITTAKDPGVPSVVDISEVQDVDLDQMDGINTGIKELDSEIMRLFYGTITVVSGCPGSGKTSFLSQILCQSLEQDKPAWIFSRELPGWMQKNWLNYILAGNNFVKEYEDKNGAKYYKVTQEAKDKINQRYSKKWFLYRDDYSNKLDDLIVSMEDSVRKYGTKLLILDNLMMIDIGANENSELMKQTECITKLIRFAMKYSVAVILVAHPRKLAQGESVGMYDISGSSNIINLAHRTIGLRKIDQEKDKSNKNVTLTIIKDRMRGKSGKKIELYYDVPSRRFYTNENEYNYQYSWDTTKHKPLEYPHKEEYEVYGEEINE